jgi:hypothetical protein
MNLPMKYRQEGVKLVVRTEVGHEGLVIIKGFRSEKGRGKYIVGSSLTQENLAVFAFDASCELHRDIAAKCAVRVTGGGHLEWDTGLKQIKLTGTSLEFGVDPIRAVSREMVRAALSGWSVS